MSKVEKAAKRALKVLEYWDVHGTLHQPTEEAIIALREALAEQPAQQETATCEEEHPNSRYLFKRLCGVAGIELGKDTVPQALDKIAKLREALAEQPAQHEFGCRANAFGNCTCGKEQPAQQEPVALDVTLEGDEARALYDLFGDDREDLSPVRLLVGDGHSGYGLYVALAEYQDEGAELIASIIPPAQRTWVGLTLEEIDTEWGLFMSGQGSGYIPDFVRAIEAKLKERNQ